MDTRNFNREEFYKSLEGKPGRSGCLLWLTGIGMLVFGAFLVGSILYPDDGSKPASIFFGIATALFLIGFLYSLKPYKPENDEQLNEIKRGGNAIVWIYPYNQTVNGLTSYWVKFMNREGKTFSRATVKQPEQQRVIEGLIQLYPEAQLGYSDEIDTEMRRIYKK